MSTSTMHVAEAGRPLSKFLTRLKRHENLYLGIKEIYRYTWKQIWLAGKSTMNEDVFPIENGDVPMLC